MRRCDLVIVGGGTGGLVCALIAAGIGARVALIERDRTGGDCLWTGCVPSKTLIATANAAHTIRSADTVGLTAGDPGVDLAAVMRHVRSVIAEIEPHDSPQRLRDAGVEVIHADGRFTAPHRIRAGDRELRWRAAIIATGSEPVLPPLDGLAAASPLTTETVWQLRELPRRLLVLGGGPVGCELGQAFGRLGSHVTIVEVADRLLTREDPRASRLVQERLQHEGIVVRVGAHPVAVARDGDAFVLELADGEPVAFDRVLVVAGRRPRTAGLGLDTVGVTVDPRGAVAVDRHLRTSARSIYAVGDVTGLDPFTHVAAHHARVATPNALFHARGQVSGTIPRVTFTDPEVAHVGLTEEQARERWGEHAQIAHHDYRTLDRAITSGHPHGFATLVADARGRLAGATICATGAGETIAEYGAWITRGATITDVSRTIHAYPTFAEGPARAADTFLTARLLGTRARLLATPALAALRVLGRAG